MLLLRTATAAAFTMLAATPAAAAQWWLIDHNPRATTFADRASLQPTGRTRTVWVRIELPPGGRISSTATHWRYDCAARTSQMITVIGYDAARTPLPREEPRGEDARVQPVVAGTVHENAMLFACSDGEERVALPFAFAVGRPPEQVAALIPRLEAMGVAPQRARFLAAFTFDQASAAGHGADYLELFRSTFPASQHAAAAALLGLREW